MPYFFMITLNIFDLMDIKGHCKHSRLTALIYNTVSCKLTANCWPALQLHCDQEVMREVVALNYKFLRATGHHYMLITDKASV